MVKNLTERCKSPKYTGWDPDLIWSCWWCCVLGLLGSSEVNQAL